MSDIPAGQPELRMVEDIEELCPEIYRHTFTEGQGDMLDEREIRVHEIRSVERSSGSISEFPGLRVDKALGVEPLA